MTDASRKRELRGYQKIAVNEFTNWFPNTEERLATIILPTGTGKTFTAISCINNYMNIAGPIKVLWVAHREELIDQAFKEFCSLIPGKDIQVEMASNRADNYADIVVASVQTAARARKNMDEFEPSLIVIDEYHHYHEKNTQYHGLLERFPDAKVLGLTATPYRFVGGDLPTGRKLIEMNIGVAIKLGYLSEPVAEVLRSKSSLMNVKSQMGDFKVSQLSEAVNNEERNSLIVDRVSSVVKDDGRQGILFAVDVEHSKSLAELFRKKYPEIRIGEVYGETPKQERKDLMERVRAGEVDVLCNNLVCTEGFDVPHMSFACIARPTKSLGLYYQMMGRALRLSKGKENALIIDVFDKVKVTQGIASYSKAASAGGIYSDIDRVQKIIEEPIPKTLTNFPVVLKIKSNEHWTIDDEMWLAPAWLLDDGHQWVITWGKSSVREEVPNDFSWSEMKFLPKKTDIEKGVFVKHNEFGEGVVADATYAKEGYHLIGVKFGDKVERVRISDVRVKTKKYEFKKLDEPVKRAVYIVGNYDCSVFRVISLIKDNSAPSTFNVLSDIKCDKNTADEMIRVFASEDDMLNIVRKDAPWRARGASDKQKSMIKNYILWRKLDSDIDIDSLTGGDASSLMDQVTWKPIINSLFGGSSYDKLIGYHNYEKEFGEI